MQDLIIIALVATHLMCMNVAAGGPLVGLWLEWRARRLPLAAAVADDTAWWSLMALLAGSMLGLAQGLIIWSDAYQQLWLERLSHKLHWGLAELAFSLVLMILYWAWRARGAGGGAAGAAARTLLLLVASTNLLYHFPPLFLVAGRLADQGQFSGPSITPAVFRQEMTRGEVPSLSVHFLLASLAVSGVLLLGLALAGKRRGSSQKDYERLCRWGGRIALGPTLLQLPVGLWVLLSLPAAMQGRLLGADGAATACFALSLVGMLWLMRELAAIALGEHERGQLVRAMVLMTAVVVLMTAGQYYARNRPQPSAGAAVALWSLRTSS